jgi:hypothetical protein
MAEEADRLLQILKNAIENRLIEVHTGLPGKVTSVNTAANTVDVQPVLQRKYADDTVRNMPVIANVPLAFPRTASAHLILPVKKDDYVWLWFSERSLDNWLEKGGIVDPQDPRKFNLSDAVAYPGCYPKPLANDRFDGENLRIENDTASIELQPSGKMKIGAVGGEQLLQILFEALTALSTASNAGGPLTSNAAVSTLISRLQTLIGV